MSTPNMNAIGWFEIYSSDFERAVRFYETVFATTLEQTSMDGFDMGMFTGDDNAYGAAGAICYHPEFTSGNNSTIVYFNSADSDIEAARVADAGGVIIRPKFSIGEHGFITLAQDTEGNIFGIHSMV